MDLGIVYLIDQPHQFWTELQDIVSVPSDASLSTLDATVRTFITFCASYHERFLPTRAQMGHCCDILLSSELFTFHSGRSCELLFDDARTTTDPHSLLILYEILIHYGVRHPSFFRSAKKWQPLLPFLMDHVLIDIDDASSDFIEARLRFLSIDLLYEVCRVQKLDETQLRVFHDDFINHLFELVEQTRSNETLNYLIINLLVSLNEQFMVASIPATHAPKTGSPPNPHSNSSPAKKKPAPNRVLNVLMLRLHSSKTFGENLIFILNRAGSTDEELCIQLLILKMLYLLFTTPGTQEYFYTNDLRVLVDVFVRELTNLPEENESLRHTYLRVLHPLLSNTQLRTDPYKPLLIRHTLQSVISHDHIRDINATTRRLVDRCLSGEWCQGLAPDGRVASPFMTSDGVLGSPTFSDAVFSNGDTLRLDTDTTATTAMSTSMYLQPPNHDAKRRPLVRSHSADDLVSPTTTATTTTLAVETIPRPQSTSQSKPPRKARDPTLASLSINDGPVPSTSTGSLASIAAAATTAPPAPPPTETRVLVRRTSRPKKSSTLPISPKSSSPPPPPPRPPRAPPSVSVSSRTYSFGEGGDSILVSSSGGGKKKGAPPPPPPKRRKAPGIPVQALGQGQGEGGVGIVMTTIASSSSPLNPNVNGRRVSNGHTPSVSTRG